MGLKGPEVLRLMGQGVIEIGATVMGYLASDDPTNEAIDLAGLVTQVGTARAITEAAKPMYDKLFAAKFGVKLLGFGTYPAQVLYCNAEIKGLADVKGKKVRVAGRSQAELIAALGGTPVTMAFGEVHCRIDGDGANGLGLGSVRFLEHFAVLVVTARRAHAVCGDSRVAHHILARLAVGHARARCGVGRRGEFIALHACNASAVGAGRGIDADGSAWWT